VNGHANWIVAMIGSKTTWVAAADSAKGSIAGRPPKALPHEG